MVGRGLCHLLAPVRGIGLDVVEVWCSFSEKAGRERCHGCFGEVLSFQNLVSQAAIIAVVPYGWLGPIQEKQSSSGTLRNFSNMRVLVFSDSINDGVVWASCMGDCGWSGGRCALDGASRSGQRKFRFCPVLGKLARHRGPKYTTFRPRWNN